MLLATELHFIKLISGIEIPHSLRAKAMHHRDLVNKTDDLHDDGRNGKCRHAGQKFVFWGTVMQKITDPSVKIVFNNVLCLIFQLFKVISKEF